VNCQSAAVAQRTRTGRGLGFALVAGLLELASWVQAAEQVPGTETHATTLRHGDLVVLLRDNSRSPRVLSGIGGLWNIRDAKGFNAFASLEGGVNFEHIHSGYQDMANRSAPRRGPYRLYSLPDGRSASLVRRHEDDPWAMASTLTYSLRDAHAIDIDFSAVAHDRERFGKRGWAMFFFANYMNRVTAPGINFRGVRGPGAEESWIYAEASEAHADRGDGGTYRSMSGTDLTYEADHEIKDNLWSYAWPRFTRPFFYGRAHHNMVLIMMFDRAWSAEDEIRMSVFRAHRRRIRGLEDQLHPAWDFAYLIKNIAEGRSYGFKARLVWKKFVSPEDCLKEYESWASRAAAR